MIASAEAASDLVILSGTADDEDEAYTAANEAIIRETEALARGTSDSIRLRRVVVIVWEGSARPGTDASGGLRTLATQAGFEDRTLLTR